VRSVPAPTFPAGFDFDELAGDVAFVVDEVLNEEADDSSILHGALIRKRIGFIGTSLGGMIGLSLFRACCRDPRIDAVVSKIGTAPRGEYRWRNGPALLMINGTADEVIPYSSARQTFRDARRPKALITLEGVRHDLNVGSDPILTESSLGFFARYLRGNPAGIRRVGRAVRDSTIATMRARW
jgi:fermentation-respiration switch protein FrsA (DUF1100 family)